MPIDPTHAEEYELPALNRQSNRSGVGSDAESDDDRKHQEHRVQIPRKGSEEMDDRDFDVDQIPLLERERERARTQGGSETAEEDDMVGKGSKVEQLIGRVRLAFLHSRPRGQGATLTLRLYPPLTTRPCLPSHFASWS